MREDQLNRWQFELSFLPDYRSKLAYLGCMGVFRITSWPEEGYTLTKANYDGFIWTWGVRLWRGFRLARMQPESLTATSNKEEKPNE